MWERTLSNVRAKWEAKWEDGVTIAEGASGKCRRVVNSNNSRATRVDVGETITVGGGLVDVPATRNAQPAIAANDGGRTHCTWPAVVVSAASRNVQASKKVLPEYSVKSVAAWATVKKGSATARTVE